MDISGDITYLCRICLSDCDRLPFVNLFTKNLRDTNILLCDIVFQLTRVDIKVNDGLPERMCVKCEHKFYEAYTLKKQTQNSLQKLLLQQKILKKEEIQIVIEAVECEDIQTFENEQIISSDIFSCDNNDAIVIEEIDISSLEPKDDDVDKSLTKIEDAGGDDAVSFLSQIMFKSPQEIKLSKKTYESRRHECEVCKKKFVKKSNLIDHLRLHANVRNYKCEECGKTFVQSGNYKSHLRIHTLERPFECPICFKSYNQSSALKIHIRTHTNEKNYVCPVCSKRFTNSSDLGKHRRIHETIKKFPCTECDKRFAQRNHLIKHKKTNHRNIKTT